MPRSVVKPPSKQGRKREPADSSTRVPNSPYERWTAGDPNGDAHANDIVPTVPQYERIKKIAAELFATRGYRAVGVAEIGEAVKLGRGALYYHISSKEDLLFSIVVRYIENLVVSGREALENEPDPAKRIYILSRQLMSTIFANLHEMTVCFREADCLTGHRHKVVSELHQSYQDIWEATLRDGERKKVFRSLDTVAIKGILGMYFYSFLWLKPGGKRSSNDIADVFAEMTVAIAELKPRK
ncbi:TetR/AcrR family transcriptional regulator [Hyphomicrobium sp.]|uniref:TetR/AcrR family transcriptional regulator n=1 Tax=Hyphomicrobium sp. TaxID=82 RepID=UPI003F7276A8